MYATNAEGTKKHIKNDGIRNVCVYCGSNLGARPIYAEAARALGRILAENGIGLVYGGASIGLMGQVARAAIDAGGYVTGIRPPNLPIHEIPLGNVHELIHVESLHERKMLMYEKSDAFIALPGGVGTLEELVEQITWAHLGHHEKPIVLVNIENYWNALLDLLTKMRDEHFLTDGLDINYHVVLDVREVLLVIQRSTTQSV